MSALSDPIGRPARPFRFARVARAPAGWGAFALLCCLLAYAVSTGQPWIVSAAWGSMALVTAFHLLRNPVTRLTLDASGLTARQGRGAARHFPRDQIAGLDLMADRRGPGLLTVILTDGRREALTLLHLPDRAALARAAAAHGLPFAAH